MNKRESILQLSPWHIDVDVGSGLRISSVLEKGSRTGENPVSLVDSEVHFKGMLNSVYSKGLEGRTFLDCACNCGAYSYWALQRGASYAYGFDAREHWIKQADFLKSCFPEYADSVRFEVRDVMSVHSELQRNFDITMFGGIFYHLPLPVVALKNISEVTDELLYFNSATRWSPLGGMVTANEDRSKMMNGVNSLNWYPTSPSVVMDILSYMGFVEFHVVFHNRLIKYNKQRGMKTYIKGLLKLSGRFGLLASKRQGLLSEVSYKWDA
ncbi:hypothetical protein AB833_02640 [Chromatiales bacterium (ex Bugula neritina AB1)]|nr:hypothetical protein AB833_02640 [Chromatiales bacterium (ex Bugula neritina AB1)]